jgi:cell division inhibitor SepF
MLYLGLGPDDEYEDFEPEPVREPLDEPEAEPATTGARRSTRPPTRGPEPNETSAVRTLPQKKQAAPRARPPAQGGGAGPARSGSVRPIPAAPNAKPHVVSPTSFNHAQEVADKYKNNQPVIINLQGAPRDLSRRLIDFASGLCYGLGGQMEKVANQVYLLTPSNVEVSAEERRRLHERGLHDSAG